MQTQSSDVNEILFTLDIKFLIKEKVPLLEYVQYFFSFMVKFIFLLLYGYSSRSIKQVNTIDLSELRNCWASSMFFLTN